MRMFTEKEVEILMQKVSETGNPRTNADRIRSMSDEELAKYLVNFKNTFGEEYEGEISCLEWLQSEVEEE